MATEGTYLTAKRRGPRKHHYRRKVYPYCNQCLCGIVVLREAGVTLLKYFTCFSTMVMTHTTMTSKWTESKSTANKQTKKEPNEIIFWSLSSSDCVKSHFISLVYHHSQSTSYLVVMIDHTPFRGGLTNPFLAFIRMATQA